MFYYDQLTKSQVSAIHFFNNYASKFKTEAQNEIKSILKNANIDYKEQIDAIENLKNCVRVGIHFHPDRPDKEMKTTIENLFVQGMYKNQFETHISAGALSPHKGGSRDIWEKQLFGGAYFRKSTKHSERPKYGALNLLQSPDGPAPRFGSCYFLLKPELSHRCTFTYLDSHQIPKEKGTFEEFDLILSTLLRDTFHYNNTLGEQNISIKELFKHFTNLHKPIKKLSNKNPKRKLNHYIEAQIHGNISLTEDVETLIADPSFKNTGIGLLIEKTWKKYSIKLLWHMGFKLNIQEIPKDFRGKEMPKLAKFIVGNGFIDTHHLGLAVMDIYQNPKKWDRWGTQNEVLQKIKLLWHVLVKYGKKYNKT
jgi:hypothetical protein